MPSASLRLVFAFLAGVFLASNASAHLPNESAILLSADEENLEVQVSLSLPTAAALLPADAAPLSSATLDQHRPALKAALGRVCALLDAQGAVLSAERVFVSLRDEHELRFQLLFPASARPARVRMPLLAGQPGGAFCAVTDLRQGAPVRAVLTAAAPELSLAASSR